MVERTHYCSSSALYLLVGGSISTTRSGCTGVSSTCSSSSFFIIHWTACRETFWTLRTALLALRCPTRCIRGGMVSATVQLWLPTLEFRWISTAMGAGREESLMCFLDTAIFGHVSHRRPCLACVPDNILKSERERLSFFRLVRPLRPELSVCCT